MSFRDDLDYTKENYPIYSLVRELQLDHGYTIGVVSEDTQHDRKTRCPVHDDQDPSAKVYYTTNSVYCWVCGKAWDPPGLFNVYHGCGLREAVRVLLRRLGRAPSQDPTDPKGLEELRRMIAELEAASIPKTTSILPWLVEVGLWCQDVLAAHPRLLALEEVEDATFWAASLEPADAARAVRDVLAWARRIHPDLGDVPQPIVEDAAAAYIAGVPSSSTGKD